MATIKIKGKNEDIWIPQKEALKLQKILAEGDYEKGQNVTVGRYTGSINNITGVFLEETPRKFESHEMEQYFKSRAEMLALPNNERVKKQANLYKLVCALFKISPDAIQKKADIEKCRQWIEAHPYRMWFDVNLWIKSWNLSGQSESAYHSSTINMLGRMVATDASEEQLKLDELNSLTKP